MTNRSAGAAIQHVAFLADDRIRIVKDPKGGSGLANLEAMLYWGDEVELGEDRGGYTRATLGAGREGWVRSPVRTVAEAPLALAFIDVGQGDACLVTTPKGYRLLIDGGENQQAARYLARRYWNETRAGKDVHFDAIIATHGDADHFAGLAELVLDAAEEKRDHKRIRVVTPRVFHNGIVKRAGSLADIEQLGRVETSPGGRLMLPLVDDPRDVNDPSQPFKRWQAALQELGRRGPLQVARLDQDSTDALAFLDDVEVSVLGPRTTSLVDGRRAVPFLNGIDTNAPSAARTINGHSVNLRLRLGGVSILLTGDVNAAEEAELLRLHRAGMLNLQAEVLKVPHHGSDDVNVDFLAAVRPLVSIISAGDEDARRDYLHPRANVLGMLGGGERGSRSVIFCTNLAAFDRWVGRAFRAVEQANGTWTPDITAGTFYARERSVHGIVHVRTDGKRLLVVRRGARADRQELYAFNVADDGSATSSDTTLG